MNTIASLNAQQIRTISNSQGLQLQESIKRNDIILIAENILDTYNVGGIFRLADSLAVQMLYLTGDTPCPPNSRIHKASCGTYKIVPWQHNTHTKDSITEIRYLHKKSMICAIEQAKDSVLYTNITPHTPLVLIVGNETYGVSPTTLAMVDHIVEIPMYGINKSLNVIVSAGIVSHYYLEQTTKRT